MSKVNCWDKEFYSVNNFLNTKFTCFNFHINTNNFPIRCFSSYYFYKWHSIYYSKIKKFSSLDGFIDMFLLFISFEREREREREIEREIWWEFYTCVRCKRHKKWYLMPPCFTLSIIRYRSRVKWSNPGKGDASFPKPQSSSYWKGGFQIPLDYSDRHFFFFQWWRSWHALLMRPNEVETAVQCFHMSCVSVHQIFLSW